MGKVMRDRRRWCWWLQSKLWVSTSGFPRIVFGGPIDGFTAIIDGLDGDEIGLGACLPSFSWRTEHPGCLGDVKDQAKILDACLGNLAIHKSNTNLPKVLVDKLTKEVVAYMQKVHICDKSECGGKRSIYCWTVLDHMKENGGSLDNDDICI